MKAGQLVREVQMLVVILGLVSCLWVANAWAGEGGKADVVLQNGKIYTADPDRSIKQSVAFSGNTIMAVGSDGDMEALIDPETKVIDLRGKLVLPGLIDTHIHPIVGAVDNAKCSLAGVKATIEALKPVIHACLANDQGDADEWFEAAQLDNYGFQATAKDLDIIEAKRPIALEGNDGHTVWVNSRGLELLGVTAETPDPRGGKIARDELGAPTGSFADSAAIFVAEKIPAPTVEEQAALTAEELIKMSAFGITSLMDAFVTPTEMKVWRLLHDSGKLPMRVRMAIYVADPNDDSDDAVERLVRASREGNIDSEFLRSGVVKVFADGVMEYPAQTAALLSPYLDGDGKPTDKAGDLYFEPERFARLVQKLDAAGLTVHIHAIGDRAVRASLDAFAAARETNGDTDNRHQIAHLQLVDTADLQRFKELGVIADMQLEWAKREPATEGPVEPYLGPDRYRYLYPAGSLHEAGAMIIGGSDWDVSSYNPFRGFQTAVTRAGGKGQKPLNIDERVPLTTVVDAYTIDAAFAMKQDTTTGSIEVGKRADLVVLDRDIFSVDPYTIGDTKVVATYLDGRLVYAAPADDRAERRENEIGNWWDQREARMRDWLHRD
jgi:predicted amidohydrolase YtcJ